jgi:hypothetical protein
MRYSYQKRSKSIGLVIKLILFSGLILMSSAAIFLSLFGKIQGAQLILLLILNIPACAIFCKKIYDELF